MTFQYKGYAKDGSPRSGLVEAADETDASRRLLSEGVYARSLAPLAAAARPLSAARRSALYRELGALLGAGLPLDRALALLREPSGADGGAAALERVADAVREGRGLAAAMGEAGAGTGAFERAALASAEASATLPSMLGRLAAHLEAAEAVRASVRSALAYPLFVLCLGAVIAAVMLGVVAPMTARSLAEAGIEQPASSRLLVGAARAAVFVLAPLALGLAAAWAVARARARRSRAAAVALDRLRLRLPLLRTGRILAAQRFASILGTLAEGGMPLPDALPLAGAGAGRPSVEEGVAAATSRIRAGESPAAALADVPYVGSSIAQWVRVGEAGGCLPQMLSVAADRLRARWERTLSTRLALLGPVLLALVGLFVLALALGLLLPMLSVAGAGAV